MPIRGAVDGDSYSSSKTIYRPDPRAKEQSSNTKSTSKSSTSRSSSSAVKTTRPQNLPEEPRKNTGIRNDVSSENRSTKSRETKNTGTSNPTKVYEDRPERPTRQHNVYDGRPEDTTKTQVTTNTPKQNSNITTMNTATKPKSTEPIKAQVTIGAPKQNSNITTMNTATKPKSTEPIKTQVTIGAPKPTIPTSNENYRPRIPGRLPTENGVYIEGKHRPLTDPSQLKRIHKPNITSQERMVEKCLPKEPTPAIVGTKPKTTVTTTTTLNATTPDNEPAHNKAQSDYDIMQEEQIAYKKSPTVLVYTADKHAVTSGLGDSGTVKAGIPINYTKTSKMSKSTITYVSSPDYYIVNHKNTYIDKNGLMRYRFNSDKIDELNDYYCLALPQRISNIADKYSQSPKNENDINAGYRLQIILKDKENKEYTFNAMYANAKNSSDKMDMYPHDHIIEFITESDELNSNICLDSDKGNIDLDKVIGGNGLEVYQIKAYKNSALFEGNYLKGVWNEKDNY